MSIENVNQPVQIEGLNAFVRSLRNVDSELPKEMKEIHKRLAEPVAETARGLAPSVSGDLARTVRVNATMRVARVAAGSKKVPYAGPIHWGWPDRHIHAQPFINDALGRHAASLEANYEKEVMTFIEKVWETKD